MTSDFTIGDATRYKAIIEGNTIKIKDLELFLKDWRTMNEKAEKWDKIYWTLEDDEMPVTPERIAMILNFVNDHFPDYDTPEEFEKNINEQIEWEGELGEAEEKLEAVKTWLKDAPEPLFLEPGRSPFISETSMEVWMEKCPLKILEDQSSGGTEE